MTVLISCLVLGWAARTSRITAETLDRKLMQNSAVYQLRLTLRQLNDNLMTGLLDGSTNRPAALDQPGPDFDLMMENLAALPWDTTQQADIEKLNAATSAFTSKATELQETALSGNPAELRLLFTTEIYPQYKRAVTLCDELTRANNRDLEAWIRNRNLQIQAGSMWGGVAIVLATAFLGGLLWISFNRIFHPLRRMAEEANLYTDGNEVSGNELDTVSSYLDRLKADIAKTRMNLERSQNYLMDSEKLATLGRLAAGVAHEIRSPLTSIKLRLFSMQRALSSNPRAGNDIQVMTEEINRLDSIIRNFLEFSRPPDMQLAPCSIPLILDKTVEFIRHKTDASRIRLVCDEPVNLPAITADANQLRQVFLNLLNNAVDAMPGGGEIQLSMTIQADNRGIKMAVVRVRDSGPGIPSNVQARIFDPFFSTKEDGAGLGLWIAQRIITQHGGRLELERSSPGGTAFAVWIPISQEKQA